MALSSRLTEHPASVDETYGEHFRFAMTCAGQLAGAAAAAAIHAVYPPAFETTASRRIKALYACVTAGSRTEGAGRPADSGHGPVDQLAA